MSLDYFVTYEFTPERVEPTVLQILGECGYSCEFQPGTNLLDPNIEGFFLKVSAYPSPRPRVRPERSFLIGIGLDDVSNAEGGMRRQLRFSTSSGRTRLESDLQILVAAAITKITRGEFVDPQEAVALGPDDALKYALNDTQLGTPPHDLREKEFGGW